MKYNRNKSVAYAHEWAYRRNPSYYNFDLTGGDCTNFISQCLYAGCGIMNYTRDTGWYYLSAKNRAAGWTGVEYLYRFLTTNQKSGPYAVNLPIANAEPGDIIQLSFDGNAYAHSLLVVNISSSASGIAVATHTEDSDNRPLNTYWYQAARLLHISGVRA